MKKQIFNLSKVNGIFPLPLRERVRVRGKKAAFTLTEVDRVPSPRGRARVGVDYTSSKQSISPSLKFVSSPQLANKFFSLPRRDRRVAFTLAEVLITLGVIGVVAAMTMPTLIKHYQQHETVNRLKETYSILYNAVRMSETENGLLENWEIPVSNGFNANTYTYGKTFFEQYLKSYIKVAKECKKLSNECWADKYTRTNGANNTYYSASSNYTYGIVLANGSVIGFYPNSTHCLIYIDLNGKKGPNKHGKDTFSMIISKTSRNDTYGNFNKSGVYMYGQGKTKTELTSGERGCSKTATTYAGIYCGALIMHDGWKIGKDYPW